MKINRCIIVGGGESLREGISKELDSKLEGEFVIGCNEVYKDFKNITLTTFVDKPFWEKHKEELKSLPLVLCKHHGDIKQKNNSNFIMTNTINDYSKMTKINIYTSVLVGIFSLSIAKLLNCNEVMLLGFDWTKRENCKNHKSGKAYTHYYQDDKLRSHRGYGLTGFYDSHNPNEYFSHYTKESMKIYNVSINSNINTFPKITYNHFFELLNRNKEYHNQDELRANIKQFFKE